VQFYPHFTINERGMVLFVCLTLLALLTALAVAALVSVRNDFKVSSNLRAGTAAFYLADAGIEWAKGQLSRTTTNPPALHNGSQLFFTGSFAVAFAAPAKLTPLKAGVDVRSIGRLANATQVIQARLSKTYDLTDAALALRGHSRGVHFDGDAFLISGHDHDPANRARTLGTRARPALSVSSPAVAGEIHGSLQVEQMDNMVGANGAPATMRSGRLPADVLARLAADLCRSPMAQNTPVPAGGLTLNDQTWGSGVSPELRCLNGLPENGAAVTLAGNIAGTGILIINDAELVALGPLRWDGLVLVSGRNAGFRAAGDTVKEVFGGLVINEAAPMAGATPFALDLRGSMRILYSSATLAAAATLIPPPLLESHYASLPYSLTQDYWRAAGP
jgi:hypothetical protein